MAVQRVAKSCMTSCPIMVAKYVWKIPVAAASAISTTMIPNRRGAAPDRARCCREESPVEDELREHGSRDAKGRRHEDRAGHEGDAPRRCGRSNRSARRIIRRALGGVGVAVSVTVISWHVLLATPHERPLPTHGYNVLSPLRRLRQRRHLARQRALILNANSADERRSGRPLSSSTYPRRSASGLAIRRSCATRISVAAGTWWPFWANWVIWSMSRAGGTPISVLLASTTS